MTKKVAISGSVAFDSIMVFEGRFKDHILPEKVHMLNVAFLVPRLKRENGGCAANIAYNMRLLGGEPAILAAVGADGVLYRTRLEALGIDVGQLRVETELFTPQAFITTDLADNQITAFHPGAMNEAHKADAAALGRLAWGIVAPNGKAAMLAHARQFAEMGVDYLFDPGQGLPMFDGDELRHLVGAASAVAVNDYEHTMLLDKTGWTPAEFEHAAGVLIVTRGAEGSDLHEGGVHHRIASAPIARALDPTGCGDAYRGGLLYGLSNGWNWQQSARLGSVMGAIKIESQGPQNHAPDRDTIAARFESAYGSRPW
ncbi:MAG: carbohydrate kinase family protein [Lautropia sp.]